MDDILNESVNDIVKILDILTSNDYIGYFITKKRVIRRNKKKKYYSFNEKYIPGFLDYLPGAKENLHLSLKILSKFIMIKKYEKTIGDKGNE